MTRVAMQISKRKLEKYISRATRHLLEWLY
jgi:hypothetical protein